jgi:hypothetical protein
MGGKLSADGITAKLDWATLPGASALRGSLHVDQTGVFSNNLVVVTGRGGSEGGEVWLVDSATNAARLTTLSNVDSFIHLEGVVTLTNDPVRWGHWAGKIITGAESEDPPKIFAVAADGSSSTNFLGIAPEDFDVILPGQFLYCCDESDGIRKFDKSLFNDYWGDLVVTQEGTADIVPTLFIVHWDATNQLFYTTRIGTLNHLEHVTFAPLELPDL